VIDEIAFQTNRDRGPQGFGDRPAVRSGVGDGRKEAASGRFAIGVPDRSRTTSAGRKSAQRLTGILRCTELHTGQILCRSWRLWQSSADGRAQPSEVSVVGLFDNVAARRIQVDEIWSFVGCKQKNVTAEKAEAGVCGDVWTFTAIEAQTKLVIAWSNHVWSIHEIAALTIANASAAA